MSKVELIHGDCMEAISKMKDNFIDAIITDPPYGLLFMGKKWDYDVPSVEIWKECLRILKPGGYLLSFAGTRTQHRMAVNIDDAGFEIRDMISWIYGSGFPKSLNIGKAVDKLQGNERENLGIDESRAKRLVNQMEHSNPTGTWQDGKRIIDITKGNSEWEGWGTALKPALEPITVARKPLEKGLTVAENCLKWGVGGINIDGCRIPLSGDKPRIGNTDESKTNTYGWERGGIYKSGTMPESGRFPSNFIHDGSQEVLDLFPSPHGAGFKRGGGLSKEGNSMFCGNHEGNGARFGDSGSAARFFYCAKASKAERNRGCDGLEAIRHADRVIDDGVGGNNPRNRTNTPKQNFHPTVKPIALMEYLVKLVTREGQTVLDPFAGSGTTGIACKNLNREAILIEREAEYVDIAERRNS